MGYESLTPARRSEHGRWAASHRERVERQCIGCGQPTIGTKKRRYCSIACVARAYRARKRDRANVS
jgi:hypothetical protein